jgi:SAM-dependent methyltransferase
MPELQRSVMRKLYGRDVWEGFRPARPPQGGVQGWNGDHPALAQLACLAPQQIVVDVGVWKGQSTITMAAAMQRARLDGCVIAVDTFLGSIEHWGAPLFARSHGLPDLYQTFAENVHYAGVADYVVPLPQTSSSAAAILLRLGIAASVVHIDASHDYADVLRDAEEFWKILAEGGFLIGDDYHEAWPGVVRAAGEFSARLGRPLLVQSPKWILRKTA